MKILKLIAIMALILPISSMANNEGSPITGRLSQVVEIVNDYYSFNKIFFDDDEGKTLFIDFEVIEDEITELNVVRDTELLMSDNVSDLPADAIYEINLDVLKSGIYTIEIVTRENIRIQKAILVK